MRKLKYFGQCDRLRMASQENEAHWQKMMANSEEVSLDIFLERVDISEILDEGETPDEWITEACMSDPDSRAYKSTWGSEPVLFFQTAGFEFIFKGEGDED